MPGDIAFSWTTEDVTRVLRDPWRDKPAWARISGFGCVALSSTAPPETGEQWVSLTETPRVGQGYPLRVWQPFRGALGHRIWVAYPPPTQSLEDATTWCDVPAALPTGGLARCRLEDVLSHDETQAHYLRGAWLRVTIEEVIAVVDLAARFTPDPSGLPLPPGIEPGSTHIWGCRWGDLAFLENSAEGDVQEWVVWQRHAGGAAVVLGGERIFDDDIMYAGHRPLRAGELSFLEACQQAAREY